MCSVICDEKERNVRAKKCMRIIIFLKDKKLLLK